MAVETNAYFTTLPRSFYAPGPLADQLFAAELERIWSREWLYLAHVSELREPGDFVVREILGESVVVVRVDADEIAVLLNVCRHRGARIVDEPSGSIRRFVCPYHRWSYDLRGALLGAPSIRDGRDIDYDDWAMYRLPSEIWNGLIFGSLSTEAPAPLADELAVAEPIFAPLQVERLRKVSSRSYEIAANWKVVLENYLECYHCRGSHPEYCTTAVLGGDYSRPTDERFIAFDAALVEGTHTASVDGRPLGHRQIGEPGSYEPNRSRAFVAAPALVSMYVYNDYASLHEIHPVTPERTQFHIHWYVHEDVSDEELDVARVEHVWHMTTLQDIDLCERTQQGLHSRFYSPGPLSALHEPGIMGALEYYLRIMDGSSAVDALLEQAGPAAAHVPRP